MRVSEFFPDSVDSLYYHFQKVDLTLSGSNIGFPEWLENKSTK